MPILLPGSGYKPAFSFSGSGTGSTRKNPDFQIAGFEPGKLESGTIKPLCMPLLTLDEWISGLFEVSVETPASPGSSSHESSE